MTELSFITDFNLKVVQEDSLWTASIIGNEHMMARGRTPQEAIGTLIMREATQADVATSEYICDFGCSNTEAHGTVLNYPTRAIQRHARKPIHGGWTNSKIHLIAEQWKTFSHEAVVKTGCGETIVIKRRADNEDAYTTLMGTSEVPPLKLCKNCWKYGIANEY